MRRPFDIVHLTHSAFPADPRPRREAIVASEEDRRVAVISLADSNRTSVGRWRGITVVRLKGSKRRSSAGGYVREYLDFVIRSWWLVRSDSRFRGARVIHVHTLPDFLVAAAAPARRHGAKVVLDLHEIFPEFVRSKFAGALGTIATPIARWLERWSRRQADVVITVNRPIETLLHARPARPRERIVVVHNSPAPGEFGEIGEPSGASASPLRLVYHGTLTGMYGVDIAIESVERAIAGGLDVAFDVYGDGPDAHRLHRLVVEKDLGRRIQLHPPVPAEALPAILRRAHAGLVTTRLDGMTRYSLSNKLLEYIHLGIPLLAPRLPTYLAYFPEETAWYFEANDPASAAAAIARFATAAPAERVRRARAAQVAARELAWSRDAEVLRGVYRDLLDGAHPR